MDSDQKIARRLLYVRLAQMFVNEEYKAGKFKIPIHLALGHEALAVAMDRVVAEGDSLVLSHRNIAYNLARTGKLRPILDEYRLKEESLAGGKLGSMNLAHPPSGIIYSSSILGNNFSVACGLAMSHELRGSGGLSAVLGGDGSVEEGSFYESMLMMKSLGLPSLVVIENNGWSLATRIEERRVPIDLDALSRSLGVRFARLSGNDVYDYIEKLNELRSYALKKKEPVCIEAEVATLGDWIGPKSPEHPHGKLINYHAGPAPAVGLAEWPILKQNEEDPVHVLNKRFGEETLKGAASEIYGLLQKELA